MSMENQEIMFSTAIKRTPVTMVGWMLVGAMILPGMGLLSGSQ
jgi:predicted nucleic acid-binding Zn ribbon protein